MLRIIFQKNVSLHFNAIYHLNQKQKNMYPIYGFEVL